MLGRQQIAGIPTAVSEIFKNAYDAYATAVRGDFVPAQRLLMIRDDGVGMSEEDFLSRWLTIGTDSKTTGSTLSPIGRPPGMAERRQMGEKGIGRLAIASTGPQLLLITRALGGNEIVTALLQWSMFEVPGLTLDDVVIPLRTAADIDGVNQEMLASMRTELERALMDLGPRVDSNRRNRILEELSYLDLDPHAYLGLAGPGPARSHGTAFIITPVSDDVDAALEAEPGAKADDYSVSEFQRFLLGFVNSISHPPEDLDFSTEFIRHHPGGYEDLIDEKWFWGAADFSLTDHTIDGEFDETGTFNGTLSVYGTTPIQFSEPWTASKGDPTACGPFKLKFGYVQGTASESRLTPGDFTQMTRRLGEIGGLYIYRDGIRVLPYGNSDNDYLEIEKRRTYNAGRYYFSYRRMFGAIELSSTTNRLLQEKAGREGFRENRAYREFREILKNFLVQVAANFFSSDSTDADTWRTERDRLKRGSAATAKREKAEERARARFANELDDRLSFVESGRLADELQAILKYATDVVPGVTDLEMLASIEAAALDKLRGQRVAILLERPAELPLTSDLERSWNSYMRLRPTIDAAFETTTESLQLTLSNAANAISPTGGEAIDATAPRRTRSRSLVASATESIKVQSAEVDALARAATEEIVDAVRRTVTEFDASVTEVLAKDVPWSMRREREVASAVEALVGKHRHALDVLARRARSAAEAESTGDDRVALQERILDLQQQVDSQVELLQLGQAVQIVSHEFDATIRSVRTGLKRLEPWARSTPRLQPIVRDLRASFAHLDAYLRLFTPLQRRLYGEEVTITGDEIASFVVGVFRERLARHGVSLTATESFRHRNVRGYPSTFYPVFTNLVDNAIYWVTSTSGGERSVVLDADENALYVRDSGPGVRPRDREVIFERGFGRRRGGRGLGLSLARELLERDGWEIQIEQTASGATFRLRQVEGSAT